MRPEGLNPRVFPSLVRPEPTARRTHQPVQPGSPQSLPTLDCAAVASEPRAGRRAAALDGLYSYSIAHPERVLTPSRHATRVRLGRRWARGNHGVRQTVVSSSGGYTGGSDSNPMTASGRGAANAGRSTTSRLCVPAGSTQKQLCASAARCCCRRTVSERSACLGSYGRGLFTTLRHTCAPRKAQQGWFGPSSALTDSLTGGQSVSKRRLRGGAARWLCPGHRPEGSASLEGHARVPLASGRCAGLPPPASTSGPRWPRRACQTLAGRDGGRQRGRRGTWWLRTALWTALVLRLRPLGPVLAASAGELRSETQENGPISVPFGSASPTDSKDESPRVAARRVAAQNASEIKYHTFARGGRARGPCPGPSGRSIGQLFLSADGTRDRSPAARKKEMGALA